MPPRRAKQEDLDEDNFDLLASQNSSNSDDTALEKALVAHYAAAKEKKRQEKERKFVDQASALLKKDLSKASDDIQTARKNIDAVYTEFLSNYATLEDRIHHLWTEVIKEHQKLEALIQRKYEAGGEMAQQANKQHIFGLSRLRVSNQEFEKVISMMIHGPGGREGDEDMDRD